MAEYAEVALVERLAGAFAAQAPRARLRLTPLNGGDAAEQLDSGAIDVAVAHLRALPARFESIGAAARSVCRRRAQAIIRRLAAPLSIEDYAALDHLLVSPRGDTSGAIDRMLMDFGLTPPHLAAGRDLSGGAGGAGRLRPRRDGAERGSPARSPPPPSIAIVPLPIDFAATVSMAWHRRAASEPAQSWFRALLVGRRRRAGPRAGADRMILATAGHIDHGKTALVRALTGVDADRLPEEKRRGMTIDLGFAYATLPDGTELGFVDVPGHERFLPNMLAGVLSIDRVLLIVAADDGPRPQTLEHLDVLELIGVAEITGVVTKIDRVPAERLAAVETRGRGAARRGRVRRQPDLPGIEPHRRRDRRARRASARRRAGSRRGARRTAGERPVPAADRPGVFAARHRAGRDRHGGVRRGRGRRPAAASARAGSRCRVRGIHAHNRPIERARAGERLR